MNVRPADQLDFDLMEPLLRVVKTLYYRFEFARGAPHDSGPFGNYVIADYDNRNSVGRGKREKLLPRIALRKRFISTPGQQNYLQDLQQDLAGKSRSSSQARTLVKAYVESALAPICPYSPVICSKALDPFFPSHRELNDRNRLVDYLRQLFDLQEYLMSDLGVKTGSLLPVWIVEKPPSRGERPPMSMLDTPAGRWDLPRFGLLPVRRCITDALVDYLLWECGAKRVGPKDIKKDLSDDFMDNALLWGRLKTFRQVQSWDMHEHVDEPYEPMGPPVPYQDKKRIFEKYRSKLPARLRSANVLLAEDMSEVLNRRGEYAQGVQLRDRHEDGKRYEQSDEERKKRNRETVNDPAFRVAQRRAADFGESMFGGDYRTLW